MSFVPLQNYLGAAGNPRAVTRDGSLIVGHTGNSQVTLIWDRFGVVSSIGPGALLDVNDSASVFVGFSFDGRPSMWSGVGRILQVLNPNEFGAANTVTANGQVSFGLEIAGLFEQRAMKFTHQPLGVVQLAPINSAVEACTPDGMTIVGEATFDNQLRPFRQVGSDPAEDLGVLAGGNYGVALDVSDDGAIAVGISSFKFFRWTKQDGMLDLDVIHDGGTSSNDVSISGDGNVVVGASHPNSFCWDELHGVRDLKTTIQLGGLDLGVWEIETVQAISYDGNVLIGTGFFGNDPELQGWMIRGFSRLLPGSGFFSVKTLKWIGAG